MMHHAESRDFNGRTTTYAYDVLNRLLSRTPDPSFTGAPAETFTYTLTGKRATMTDASGGTTYSYTNRDQVLSKSTTFQGALSYTYDLSGNVASVVSSNANGTSVSYTWDAANQLATVMDHWTNGQTSYAFDQTGQLSNVSYPNGVKHNYTTYDTRDRLTNLNVTGPGGAIASYVQAFSLSGRKTSATEATGRAANYGYDTIYRLLSENITGDPTSANNGSLGYSLDNVGNRSSLASNLAALASQSFTYDANDRISGDTFDTNGNTLTSGGHTFTYDFQDRLKQYDNTVAMVYDGDGTRVARTEGGVTHRYLIDDQTPTGYPQIAEELVPTDGVIRQHTYGTMRISQRQLLVSPNWQVSYYGYDGGGSVRQLTDTTGTVTDAYAYDAFGNTVARTGTTFNQFLYRGEQFDSTLGMYNLRARYYRPQVGRFITMDPSDRAVLTPAAANEYTYANADPANLGDPSGLLATVEQGLLSRFIQGVVTTGLLIDAADPRGQGPIPRAINCIFEKTCDLLQIALLKILLEEFPDLPLPPPPDPNTQLAGYYVYNPECRLWKCAIRCDVVDFSEGFNNTVAKVTVLGAGDTPEKACEEAERNGNDMFNPHQPQHHLRRCNKKRAVTWK